MAFYPPTKGQATSRAAQATVIAIIGMTEERKYRPEPGINKTLKAAALNAIPTKEMKSGHTGGERDRASRHKAAFCPLLVFSSSKGKLKV